MKRPISKCTAAAMALTALAVPASAAAASLGNMAYTQAELEKPISFFGGEATQKWASGPTGSNTLLMLRKVCIIMGSNDSGAPPGSFHMYDLKDPRKPQLLKTYDGTSETSHLRELHAMPVAIIDGKDYLVAPTTTGLQFFDFTDPMNPKPSGNITLKGVNAGDYDNAVWMVSWAWPYVYAGSTGNGVFIVDATDPAHPTLVKQMETGSLGNFRVGPAYAAGNYVIVANMDQASTHFSVLDVGDPTKPRLVATANSQVSLYSALVVGDRIYGAGTNGDYAFLKWTPTTIKELKFGKSGKDRGGYCTYQSGYTICGQSSEGYKKWDVRDENNPMLVGTGTDPEAKGGDFDFATVLGNLVYLGNDHGSGAALVPHAMAPDTTAPEVVKMYPGNGDIKQPLTSRITLFFSEDIDLDSLNTTNLSVHGSDGKTVDGVFSRSSFNAISFGAKAPLTANTTYEVTVPKGGLSDLVGNPIATAFAARFSTGMTIDGGPIVTEPMGGSAGMPGTAGAPPNGGSGGSGGVVGTAGTESGGAAGAGTSGQTDGGAGSPVTSAGSAGTSGGTPKPPETNDAAGCGISNPSGTTHRSAWLALAALGFIATRRRLPSLRSRSARG